MKTLRIAVYVLAAVALLPFAFSQELLKLAPFGRPIAVMDEADNWSIPISLYSDSEVEMFVPDITTEGWIAWHIKQFRETGKYGVYVYTFFKNDQFCRRERIPAEDKTDPKWLEGCSALRYQRKLLEVDTRKNTVRVYSVLVMQKDAVANPMNQKVFNVVFPLVKLDSSQRQAYHRLSAIVTREMNEYKGMSVEESVRQTSKVVSNMMENLTNGAVCPETGKLVSVPSGHTVWDSPDCPPTTAVEKSLSSAPATKAQLPVTGANRTTDDRGASSPATKTDALTGTYSGKVHNTTARLWAAFGTTIQVQEGNGLSGCMFVHRPLYGSGKLSGSSQTSQVTFDVPSLVGVIRFTGTVDGDDIRGTYAVQRTGVVAESGEFELHRQSDLPTGFNPQNCPTDSAIH
ncbi:MAG: hypothetical protein WCC04_21755 [Terriglobales bacterium]